MSAILNSPAELSTRGPWARLPLLRSGALRMSAAVIAVVSALSVFVRSSAPPELPEVLTVTKSDFSVSLRTRGTLEPLRTQRVISQCQWTVQILSLVPEGTWVSKGDVVCVLDSSEIQEFQRSREVSLVKGTAALEASLQEEQLTLARNERRLAEAQHALQAAELEMLEYMNGMYPNEVQELQDEIAINSERLETAVANMRNSERLWMLGFSNRASVDAEALKVTTQAEELRRLKYSQNLLQDFSHPRRDIELSHQLTNSRLNVVRTELRNSLAVSRARMETLADQHRLAVYERYARSAGESIKACTLRAPCDGQVIHCNSWHLRSRGITSIEEGKSVYFSQPVFEIPDQNHLKIRFPLNETLVTQVSAGDRIMVTPFGFESMQIPAVISRISPYPVRNRYAPDLKEYFLDAVLEPDPEQGALLRPRMEAEATLTLFQKPEAITVPASAIVRCNRQNFVLRRSGEEFLPCPVIPDEVSDGRVLITAGLSEGDQVIAKVSEKQRRELEEQFGG